MLVEDPLLLPPLLFFSLIFLFEVEPRPRSNGVPWAVHGVMKYCGEATAGRVTDCCIGWARSTILFSVAPAFLLQICGVFLPQHLLCHTMRNGSLSSSRCNCQGYSSLPEKSNCISFSLLVHIHLRARVALLRSFLLPEVNSTDYQTVLIRDLPFQQDAWSDSGCLLALHPLLPGSSFKQLLEISCKQCLFSLISAASGLWLGSTSSSRSVTEATQY